MKFFNSPFAVGSQFLQDQLYVTPGDMYQRLSGKMEVRSNEGIATVLASIEPGQTLQLAPDTWTYNGTLVIDKSCSIVGHPLGTKIKRGEGLTSGPLVSIEADNVILKNIYFEDDTDLSPIQCVNTSSANTFISECTFVTWAKALVNDGGNGSVFSFNVVSATSAGVDFNQTSSGHRIIGNSVTMTPDTGTSIGLDSQVTATAIVANNCNAKITFHNTGLAQTFAAPGGSSNHVSGNVAALTETT